MIEKPSSGKEDGFFDGKSADGLTAGVYLLKIADFRQFFLEKANTACYYSSITCVCGVYNDLYDYDEPFFGLHSGGRFSSRTGQPYQK